MSTANAPLDISLVSKNDPISPSLRFIFRLKATLAEPLVIGDGGQGVRKAIAISGGVLESRAQDLRGEDAFDGAQSIEGGADHITIDTNGLARPDARYVFRLQSGHYLFFQSSGRRLVTSGNEESSRLLGQGKEIDPSEYYFRLKLILESDDPHPAIQEACAKIVVASAVRGETSIVYDAYVLE